MDAPQSKVQLTKQLHDLQAQLAHLKQHALEHEQSQKVLLERERFLTLLNEITRIALDAPDLPALLQSIVNRIGKLFGSDTCCVTLWDEQTNSTLPTAAYGYWQEAYTTLGHEPGETTLTESALRAGRPLVIDNMFDSPYVSRRTANLGPEHAVLVAPLVSGSKKLGAVIIGFNQPHRFTGQEISRGEQVAGQIALAIAKIKALQEAQSRYHELETMRRATAIINETLSLDNILNRILEQLERVIPYDSASVQLLRNGHAEIVSARGELLVPQPQGLRFPVPGNNPNTIVVQTRQPLLVNRPAEKFLSFKEVDSIHIMCWFGVPLIVRGEVIGLITLDGARPNRFRSDQIPLAMAFADAVAVALHNAQLFDQTQLHSTRLARILSASELLHRGLEVQQVLEQIAQGMVSLGFRIAAVNVYYPEEGKLRVQAMAGATDEERAILAEAEYHWADFQALMQDRFRISRSYLVPHTEHVWGPDFAGPVVITSGDYRGPGYWHPEDSLMIPLHDSQGNPLGVVSVDQPVEERQPDLNTIRALETFANHAAIALENARLHRQARLDAETKATLLREVNHRVQNNLTAILGLISIERNRHTVDSAAGYKGIMQNLAQRITGLATAHRMLSAAQWSTLPLAELCRQVVAASLQILPLDKHIKVEVFPSAVEVCPRYANSLALVINELATNTIKYGLTDRQMGRITITISSTAEDIVLEYRDDGPGYPADTLTLQRRNVGLQIIHSLVKGDLAGKLALSNGDGAVAVLYFPLCSHCSQPYHSNNPPAISGNS
jgi:GAF domain-containing protein